MTVRVVVECGPWKGVARREVERRATAMLGLLQLQESELSIVLTDDDHIHELNKVYRAKDKPTDVLAFAMREGEFSNLAGELLGDVIVSIETARRQAAARQVDALTEVTMLVAHGLLHLLGWDHDTPARDKAMRKETDRLCVAAAAVKYGPASGALGKKGPASGALGKNRAASGAGRRSTPSAKVSKARRPQRREPKG
ncbi:rRNA maturation RNase YbeY [Pendulispora rubella]|uniref:Endoribonuclease YbeY n=1 Tax=Pendulispora rubella TaxID=2741070 RepID=A0ABZ2KY65_9BACT